jgi:hypothetical protein
MKYEIILDSLGKEHIMIWHNEEEFTSMPKSVWDELEAAKENGTIS